MQEEKRDKEEKLPKRPHPFGNRNLRGFLNEKQFFNFCKWALFITLTLVELLMLMQQIADFTRIGDLFSFLFFLGCGAGLLIGVFCNLFLSKGKNGQFAFYSLQAVCIILMLCFNASAWDLAAYILVLTNFYVEANKIKRKTLVFILGILTYFTSYALHLFFQAQAIEFFYVLKNSLGAIVWIAVHYVAVLLALIFYGQYQRLNKALEELDESKRALEKAYAAVAEVTALEERQRIAKDIHDTAGHSLTTVIMQTEAAKRIVEEDPKEAKNKIVAANLQAKHALDELRNSVHLLSGGNEQQTLKGDLEGILHETMDGTEIIIRSEIEDLTLSPTKHRFLCNSLKEGISNGLRHGGATAFWFELKQDGDKVEFLLSDNGKGLGKDFIMGFGLTSMRDRARTLGGEVYLESEEGEGVELRIQL